MQPGVRAGSRLLRAWRLLDTADGGYDNAVCLEVRGFPCLSAATWPRTSPGDTGLACAPPPVLPALHPGRRRGSVR